jgi:hypothetical protein
VLVVGNLDCELAWAGGGSLPRHVARKLAAASTLLRAVVPDGDEAALWAPGPVDMTRCPAVTGSPPWRVVDAIDGASAIPWGATPAVAPRAAVVDGPWRDQLAALAPAVAAARAASDRRLAHAVAARLGCGMSGSRTIATVDELAAHLAALAPAAWVVKAPLTAAGRDRVRRRGPELDAATATRVRRLLDHFGALVFEPWLDRVADLGQPGLVTGPSSWRLLPAHVLHSDPTGGFAGITIPADDDLAAIPAAHRARLADIAATVAAELAALAYRGPFTIDAFVHRDAGGDHLVPLVEINPRLTFGLVARAWSERLATPLTLRLAESAPPPGALVLLTPATDDLTAAWLELR